LSITSPDIDKYSFGGAENDGHENAGHEIDGPVCRAFAEHEIEIAGHETSSEAANV